MTDLPALHVDTENTKVRGEGQIHLRENVAASREAILLFDALPRKMKAVLSVMMDRKSIGWTQQAIADEAGCSRKTVERCERDERFILARQAMCSRAIFVNLPAIVNSSIRSAALEGKDGFQDRRILMEMARVYEPTMHQKHSGRIVHESEVGDRLAQAIFAAEAHRERISKEDATVPERLPVIDVSHERNVDPEPVDMSAQSPPQTGEEFEPI